VVEHLAMAEQLVVRFVPVGKVCDGFGVEVEGFEVEMADLGSEHLHLISDFLE
jgi:hypothetical protein